MSVYDLSRIADESFVAQIDFHPRIGSTNDQAINLIKNDRPNLPLLVLAEDQFAGRGQGNASWIAESGSLTFSLCIPSRDCISTLFPLATGLAVSQTIEQFQVIDAGISLHEPFEHSLVQLKWPNDVLVGGKKIAGILIENVAGNHWAVDNPGHPNTNNACHDSCYVVGIGVNVNNDLKPMERSVRPSISSAQNSSPRQVTETKAQSIQQFAPTSLRLVTGRKIELTDFLISLLSRLQATLQQLADDPDSIVKACQAKLIILNRKIEVRLAGDRSPPLESSESNLTGECVGLGRRGELLVNTGSQVKAVFSGQIIWFE